MCSHVLLDGLLPVLVATIGALLTIITVVFTLAYTKRECLKELSEEKKLQNANPSPLLDKRINSAVNYVNRMNRILSNCTVYLVIAFLLFSMSFLISNSNLSCRRMCRAIMAGLDLCLLGVLCFYFIRLVVSLRKDIDISPKSN